MKNFSNIFLTFNKSALIRKTHFINESNMYLSCTIIVLKCHSYDREAIHLQNLGNGCNNACIVASQVYFSQIQQNACGEETGIISKNVADRTGHCKHGAHPEWITESHYKQIIYRISL